MNTPRVIVCERSRKWALALARHLPSAGVLRQTRGLKEPRVELTSAPASLLVLELTAENRWGVLALLGDLAEEFPLARAAVLADADMKSHEWLMREAGASFFSSSVRDAQQLARLAERHLSGVVSPGTDLAGQIWDSLPWGDGR
jgi:hypothetical protein